VLELEGTQRTSAPVASNPSIHLDRILDDLREVLFDPMGTDDLPGRVDTIAASLSSYIAKDADRALFLMHRHRPDRHAFYSVLHAARCAIACDLITSRLGWSERNAASLVKAALTMNIAITELQGTLAMRARSNKPTPEQALAIAGHPTRGAEILLGAGVDDVEWLRAVAQHHERVDGRGYPTGTCEPSCLAGVLRTVDDFFAKTSARASRPALPWRRAAGQLFADAGARTIVEALIKEFGLYPPGTFVRLANGDLGIVLRRTTRVDAPLAVALANRNGERLPCPLRRDTGDTRYTIVMASNANGRTTARRQMATETS